MKDQSNDYNKVQLAKTISLYWGFQQKCMCGVWEHTGAGMSQQLVQYYNAHSPWKTVCKTSSHGASYIAHGHLDRSTDLLSTPHLVCLFLCNHLLLKICSGSSENLPRFHFPRPRISFFFFFHILILMSPLFPSRGNVSIQRKLLCKVAHRARTSLQHTFSFYLPVPRNSSYVHFLLRLATDFYQI